VPFDINFNELKLQNWTKKEVLTYFTNLAFDNPEQIYEAILSEVHEVNHPVLTRPFLLAKLSTAIEGDVNQVSEFFSCKCNENESVSYIVESFTKREVEKWKGVDNKTGEPYLSFEQHIQLLSTIAKEMWDAKKDTITIEEIEIYSVLLFEEWNIEEELRKIIIRIVGSHAFLPPVNDAKMDSRKFEHFSELKRFLYIEQLPDSVAMYCFNYVDGLSNNVHKILGYFKAMLDAEWKPTYLQLNIGTLLPFMIDKIDFKTPICFDSKVNYSSLIFENKKLSNITFQNGTFINISLRDTILDNVCIQSSF